MKTLLLGVGVASLLGCASVATRAETDPYFRLRGAGTLEEARLTGRRFFGPRMEIALLPDGYRGTSPSGFVDLRSSRADRLSGTVGRGPTDLFLDPWGDGFTIRGLYAGHLGYLEVTSSRVSGTVGRCSYQLEGNGGWYRGGRVCGGAAAGFVELGLPADLPRRPPAERALLLALFLGA